MKNFLIGKVDGEHEVLIEWDRTDGTMSIKIGSERWGWDGMEIKHGVSGEDEVFWQGEMFRIMRCVHDYFVNEFAPIDPVPEYVKADGWCKRKGRKIKNERQFMYNWLNRCKGGKVKRGGVHY